MSLLTLAAMKAWWHIYVVIVFRIALPTLIVCAAFVAIVWAMHRGTYGED